MLLDLTSVIILPPYVADWFWCWGCGEGYRVREFIRIKGNWKIYYSKMKREEKIVILPK